MRAMIKTTASIDNRRGVALMLLRSLVGLFRGTMDISINQDLDKLLKDIEQALN